MESSRVRAIAAACGLLVACGGAHSSFYTPAASAPLSADAPSWARAGDTHDDQGSLLVCEGAGADEAGAVEAARAVCSGKICELCGVEVKSTVETLETLKGVDVQRKVVETCRRVRKSEEQIRYRQAGCGPGGCTAWLQVFFGKEDEARECRAYADGNFADSAQCEDLIERFRRTPDVTAASFRERAELLTQAIVACAEIDVRPTPKLTAMDEILWQGVVGPRVVPRARRTIDKAQPIAERLRLMALNTSDAWKAEFGERAYQPISRQPLLESKVFVDRLAIIRDAMVGYASIMGALEALVDAEQAPDAGHDGALVRALRELRPVSGVFTPERVLAWVADELGLHRDALTQPAIKAYFMELYATQADGVGRALLRAMVVDERADEQEWRFVLDTMRCFSCATTLLDLPEQGGEPRRVARLLELARRADASNLKDLQGLNPELLLRVESSLDPGVAAAIFTYEWLAPWLRKLPTLGTDPLVHTLRRPWTSQGYDWRWTVSPAQHRQLAARAWQLYQVRAGSLRCDQLDGDLGLLEGHGVDTRALEPTLCRCVSEPKRDGMRDLTELYQRLVAWGASCVTKGAT